MNYVATMDTSCGTIKVALDTQQYPTAVNNFVSLGVQAEVPTTAPGGSAYPVGTVAFATASSDPPGTASSQFFIVTGSQGLQLIPTTPSSGR